MYKRKILFLFSMIILSTLSVLGQKELHVIEREISNINRSDSAVIKIESTLLLSFDSNTDDPGFASGPYIRDGFYVYELKFPTGKKAYQLRELKVESDGFISVFYPLHDLKAKNQVELLVVDKDVWNCYENNLKEADNLYERWQYKEAAEKYVKALNCGYEPENNNLQKRIEDVENCADTKFLADYFYGTSDYVWAKEKYEELYRLNPNDTYAKERIDACQIAEEKRIAEQKAKEAEEKKIAEQKVKEAEEKRVAELKAKEAEEKRIAEQKAKEAEEKRIAEQKAKEAEEKRVAEQKAKEAEEKRAAELKAKEAEEKRIAEQKAKEAEEKRVAEQKVKEAEEKRIAEQKAKEAEEKRIAEQKVKDDQRRIEEEKRLLQQRTKQLLDRLPASVNVLSSGETKTFSINDFETPWDILNLPTWCLIEKKENILILTCEPNTNANAREGSFEIRAGGQSKKILIKQNKWTSLTVSHNHIEFNSSGGKDTITVSTNAASWKPSGLPSWCSLIQKGKTLILTCNPNLNTSVREGTFSIQAGDQSIEITIKQKEKIFLELSDDIVKFSKSGGKNNLTVTTNASSWNISNEIPWCSMVKFDNSILFSCEANPDTQERNETFYITAGNESKSVQVTQTDITNLEKGYWKQAIEKVIHYGATILDSGDFFKGSFNGLGVYYFSSSNESYWGELSKKLSNGKGIHILEREGSSFSGCPDCQYYAGNWSDDKKSGKGNCYDKTGKLLYSDLFVNDRPNKSFPQSYSGSQSFESIEYENGDIYLGETYNGLRHGLGIFVWANGDTWYGEWKDDKLLNESAIEYPYRGGFKTGKQIGVNDLHKQSLIYYHIESKPTINPFSAKLSNKGGKVFKNENELTKDEVRALMANTNALIYYDKGFSFNKTGNILLVSGGAMFGVGFFVGVPMASQKAPKVVKAGEIVSIIAFGTGAAAIISGAVLKILGIDNIKKSIDTYKAKSARAELRFNFTGNGVHLTLWF